MQPAAMPQRRLIKKRANPLKMWRIVAGCHKGHSQDSVLGGLRKVLRGAEIAWEDRNGLPESNRGPRSPAADPDTKRRVARLTAGQLDCLRLVDQHLSSKEIASELKISPHTVDQRIRQALQILGVQLR